MTLPVTPLDGVRVVLIVEDEEPIAQALAFIVEDAGYTPLIASHGKAALDIVHSQRLDLILTDLMMPQMNGTELIAALRAEQAQGIRIPPIVIMSAAGPRYTNDSGADESLPKPFEIDEVEALLRRFLH